MGGGIGGASVGVGAATTLVAATPDSVNTAAASQGGGCWACKNCENKHSDMCIQVCTRCHQGRYEGLSQVMETPPSFEQRPDRAFSSGDTFAMKRLQQQRSHQSQTITKPPLYQSPHASAPAEGVIPATPNPNGCVADTPPIPAVRAVAQADSDTTWPCPVCGELNPTTNANCDLCGSDRPPQPDHHSDGSHAQSEPLRSPLVVPTVMPANPHLPPQPQQ